jgi:hypothetical protein
MPISAVLHISNEEPILVDMEEIPDPTAQAVVCTNARKRDGREIHYVDREAVLLFFPWHRIGFIEIIGAGEEVEEIISFVRE